MTSHAHVSRSRLHPPVLRTSEHREAVSTQLKGRIVPQASQTADIAAVTQPIRIPLTTVSLSTLFDAYIEIGFDGAPPSAKQSMIVDSGNSVLIVPRWEDLSSLNAYTVIGESPEPWGCPAKVVRGPILLETIQHGTLTINDCIFYACYADNPNGEGRTANFGAGLLSPWKASGWNDLSALSVVLQSPLSYLQDYHIIEFDFEAAANVLTAQNITPQVSSGSALNLYSALPAGYNSFKIVENLAWMSLSPFQLLVEGKNTGWPGSLSLPPIAMIDTGGGPVLVNDPNKLVAGKNWPQPVINPDWTSGSQSCTSNKDAITIVLGDASGRFTINIMPDMLPVNARGLSLVACQYNEYLRGQQGLNIGGISALFNFIAIDHANNRVGFKPKASSQIT